MASITLGTITVSRTYLNDDALFYDGEITFSAKGQRVEFEYKHPFQEEPRLQEAISDALRALNDDLLRLSKEVETFKLPSS